jgi:hypothetical protein
MRLACALVALVLVVPAGSAAQDLGAAAAKEKQRREEARRKREGAAKTVTEDDLASYAEKNRQESPAANGDATAPGGGEGSPSPETGAPPTVVLPGAEQRETASEERDSGARDRLVTDFRLRLRSAEKAVLTAEKGLADAEDYLGKVKRTPVPRMGTRERADERVEAARAELERAKEARDAILDEARRAGLFPGDLR